MSKKKKKLTAKELEKLGQELISQEEDLECALDILLGPSNDQRINYSLKTPSEKLENYNLLVDDSIFWASREAYLEMLQSFLLKKIDGETLTSKFFELRMKNIRTTDEVCAMIEDQILPIPDLYYTFKASDFNSTINELFLDIDRYDPEIDTILRSMTQMSTSTIGT